MPTVAAKRTPASLLGVDDPQRPSQWLLRLFVLPPSQAQPLPRWLTTPLRPLALLLIRELGVREPHSLRAWLSALILMHEPLAAQRITRAGPTVSHFLFAPLWRLLRPVLLFLSWPLRRLSARFDRVDFGAATARMERVAAVMTTNFPVRLLLLLIVCGLLYSVATTPLSWNEQLLLFLLMWLTTLLIRRMPGTLPTLVIVGFSLCASSRYIWWRLTQTLDLNPGPDFILGIGLIAAESYTWVVLVLGYVQNTLPLKRKPVLLPADTRLWPTVDVYIPTYNESLKIVKPTVLAALAMDWPRDKLRVFVLDDGKRESFRNFADEVGARYITRDDNAHAKAGNLNHALTITEGEYIAIFDCDHIPVRSFLQTTMGWFLRDPLCAMLQTPHHFYSPDPFERNLGTFRQVPNEGSLFYGLVQDGNDLWNATFFCGSCAVIRRKPLEEIGGIAVETVTEDAHTALKLHRRGYNTAYLNVTQAAGLATESLAGHIGQRIRWARGMAQIFRTDNPLLGKGLKLFQRLCYTNAMLHYFNGLPRLVFLTSPLAFLYFHFYVINASAAVLAIYVLPHLFQASLANARIQGRYRHSFWAEVYESVLAWYIALPTTLAVINPRIGKFNVTGKGGLVEQRYFAWRTSLPYLILASVNLIGLLIGVVRLWMGDGHETSTIIMNMLWAMHNAVMLGAAIGVGAESRQTRAAHRVPIDLPATLYLADGRTLPCRTVNYSISGFEFRSDTPFDIAIGTRLQIGLQRGSREFTFAAHVMRNTGTNLGMRLQEMTPEQETNLMQCTFGRADAWLEWSDHTPADAPLTSLWEVLKFGVRGYSRLFESIGALIPSNLRLRFPRRVTN